MQNNHANLTTAAAAPRVAEYIANYMALGEEDQDNHE